VEFPHEEAIVIHFTEDQHEVAGPEGELDLAVDVGGELVRIVVVESEFSSEMLKCSLIWGGCQLWESAWFFLGLGQSGLLW
jgi:hypothetical protein